MSVYMNDNVNNSFRKEPDAEKPHVRIMGIDELSVSPTFVLKVRDAVRNIDLSK